MFGRTLGFAHWAIVPLVALATAASAQTPAYIAGVQPDSRPAAAPRIERFEKPAGWLGRATRGVEKPHPDSLKFLDDQGAWYTPFTRPGMTGPYDIRHLAPVPKGRSWQAGREDSPRTDHPWDRVHFRIIAAGSRSQERSDVQTSR